MLLDVAAWVKLSLAVVHSPGWLPLLVPLDHV